MNIKIIWIRFAKTFVLMCLVFSFNAMAQTSSDKLLEAKELAALVKELKEVVTKTSPDKNEAKQVIEKWDNRKDLAGKTKAEAIELLFEDVKSVIKDSGTQYQIYSIFSFQKQVPIQTVQIKESMSEMSKVEAEIIALEKQAWAEWKNANRKFIEDYVADDAFFVYPEGVINKSQIIEAVGSCQFKSYSLEDFKVKILDKNAVLISYTANQNIICNGKPAPKTVRSTSVYVKRGGKWFSTFYTETAVSDQSGAMQNEKPETFSLRPALEKEYGYIHAMRVGDDLKISGAVSMDDQGTLVAPGNLEQQMKNCYADLEKILKHYGYTFDDVTVENVFTTDMAEFIKVSGYRNSIYKNGFPTGTWLEVKGLALPGQLIEIDMEAHKSR
ncbi:MAG: Rid family hydrolase [Pyrinomonadaceae bacterium]